MCLVILHKSLDWIDVYFVQSDELYIFCDVSMTAYTAHLGGWNIFLDILVGYDVEIEIWGD